MYNNLLYVRCNVFYIVDILLFILQTQSWKIIRYKKSGSEAQTKILYEHNKLFSVSKKMKSHLEKYYIIRNVQNK